MGKKRLFIALNLPAKLKDELADLIEEKKKLDRNYSIKWVKPEGLHLTLLFLGYLAENDENRVKTMIKCQEGKFGQICLKFGQIGAFPSISRPRVIFIKCQQINGDSLFKLQSELASGLTEIGLEVDQRPWQAHLTLGRVREGYSNIDQNLFSGENLALDDVCLDSLELMESNLKPSGAEYKVVESVKL